MEILSEVAAAFVASGDGVFESSYSDLTVSSSSSRARAFFRWFGTIAAIFLLILNRTGPRSPNQTTLLVFYLLVSFPTGLFKILRGQFGRWVSFFAVAANLFFPRELTVARFLLFVITPDWVVNGLRNSIAGPITCLVIGVAVIITAVPRIADCNFWRVIGFCIGIIILFSSTISYLCSGNW